MHLQILVFDFTIFDSHRITRSMTMEASLSLSLVSKGFLQIPFTGSSVCSPCGSSFLLDQCACVVQINSLLSAALQLSGLHLLEVEN